jgi:hypothetical protein
MLNAELLKSYDSEFQFDQMLFHFDEDRNVYCGLFFSTKKNSSSYVEYDLFGDESIRMLDVKCSIEDFVQANTPNFMKDKFFVSKAVTKQKFPKVIARVVRSKDTFKLVGISGKSSLLEDKFGHKFFEPNANIIPFSIEVEQ